MLSAPITPIKPAQSSKPSFKSIMNSVRYVTLDGAIVEDKKIMEDIIKQFIKMLNKGNIENKNLFNELLKEMPEYCPYGGPQTVKFLKTSMLGKYFNIIIGAPAYKLKFIWQQAGVSLDKKKQQASEVVKNIIYGQSHKQIALHAITEKIKGKTKYIVQKIHTTV